MPFTVIRNANNVCTFQQPKVKIKRLSGINRDFGKSSDSKRLPTSQQSQVRIKRISGNNGDVGKTSNPKRISHPPSGELEIDVTREIRPYTQRLRSKTIVAIRPISNRSKVSNQKHTPI